MTSLTTQQQVKALATNTNPLTASSNEQKNAQTHAANPEHASLVVLGSSGKSSTTRLDVCGIYKYLKLDVNMRLGRELSQGAPLQT